jgi:hypothetical protein
MAMTFCYQSPHYQRLSYGIDVIRADHIGHYLERCEKRQQAVVEKLFSLAEREGDAITAPDGRAYRERPLVSAGR